MTRPFLLAPLLAGALALTAATAAADEVADGIEALRDAYEAGDIGAALEELSFLQAMLTEMRTDSLAEYLPEPPDGWTREVETEVSGMMAFTGGGAGATGTYSDGTDSFTISILADSPMIAAMGGMLSSPLVAQAAGGRLKRVGDIKVLDMDGSLTALVDGRILVQAEGAATEVMLPVLETMDFDGLSDFKL